MFVNSQYKLHTYLVLMQVREAHEDFSRDEGDPIFREGVVLDGLDELSDGACAAVLHHQPQLVILAVGTLLDEGAVVGGYVAVVRVLLVIFV